MAPSYSYQIFTAIIAQKRPHYFETTPEEEGDAVSQQYQLPAARENLDTPPPLPK